MSVKLLGFQIENTMDTRADERRMAAFGTDDVLPLRFALEWIRKQEDRENYVLGPVFEGDLEHPKFPQGRSSLDIRVEK